MLTTAIGVIGKEKRKGQTLPSPFLFLPFERLIRLCGNFSSMLCGKISSMLCG
jgi:hypothetical protein